MGNCHADHPDDSPGGVDHDRHPVTGVARDLPVDQQIVQLPVPWRPQGLQPVARLPASHDPGTGPDRPLDRCDVSRPLDNGDEARRLEMTPSS